MAPRGKADESGSVVDGLKAVYGQIANLALAHDAAQFGQVIEQLRQVVLKAIDGISQAKAQQAAQMQAQQRQMAINPQMGGPGSGAAGPGMPGGPPGGAPGPGHPGMPGGPPSQGSPGIAMPNPDELRRVLAAQGNA